MNRALIGCAGFLVLVLLVVLGVGTLASKDWRVERSTRVNAPPERIYPWVADLRRWRGQGGWSHWTNNANPSGEWTEEGEPGAGMKLLWTSDRDRACTLWITEAAPNRVAYDLSITDFRSSAGGELTFVPTDDGTTHVTWLMEGEMEGVLGGLFAGMMDAMLGETFEEDLARLKRNVEAGG